MRTFTTPGRLVSRVAAISKQLNTLSKKGKGPASAKALNAKDLARAKELAAQFVLTFRALHGASLNPKLKARLEAASRTHASAIVGLAFRGFDISEIGKYWTAGGSAWDLKTGKFVGVVG